MVKSDTKTKLMNALSAFVWSTLGAVIVSFFFISTFLSAYSPLAIVDAGAMFFGPLFCGMVLGIILKEFEMPALTASVAVLTTMAIVFIGLIIIAPVLQAQEAMTILIDMEVPKFIALSAIFIFPLSLIGMVIGKALGETVFLTERERTALKALRKEAKEWHEELEKK
jgi:hypothetical protein